MDESTIQWWGKPGYIDPTYFLNFWTPYPQHLWESFAVDELPEMDEAARMPVGWGPYVITEWVSGSQITLLKNPNYFRASEALPKFNMLIFRFVSDTETAIADQIAGRCDLLDASIHLDGEVSLLASLHEQGQIRIFFSTTPIMERLDLGIQPASYDERFVLGVDRPDFFGDVLVRQALAMCIDRQKIVDTVLYGLSSVPDSYIPTEHPLHESALMSHSYDISAANQLLEQVGWQDLDGDPSTARQARGVNGVRNGTSFEITYLTTGAAQRVQVATIVAESLAQCGVKVNIQYLDNSTLYAAGPQGPLFGRTFDMAEYALGTIGLEPPCEWFTSSEIPTIENHWVGTNISGFTDLTYDSACRSARQSLPEEKGFTEAYHQTQTIFAEKIPMIPLYWRLKIAAARPDLCGFSLDPTALSSMWNIETLGYGEVCNQ